MFAKVGATPGALPPASNFDYFERIRMKGKPGDALHPGVGAGATVSAEDVRRQLHRILGSSPFLNARRASQFLRFVVEGTLAGEDGFKEYLIGIEVFERPQDYDPKDDPVVRIEAGRLRKKLAEFYAGPGANDPIIIELPRGGYVPVFHERPAGVELEKIEVETSPEPEAQRPTDRAAVAPNSKLWRTTALLGMAAAVLIVAGIYYRAHG